MNLDHCMNNFRAASRDLFNRYFRTKKGWKSWDESWALRENFSELELVMFQTMVCNPLGLPNTSLGQVQERIKVVAHNYPLPAMVNRDIHSGYWDFPVCELGSRTTLLFISFFDWDNLEGFDNQYVRALILDCPRHPEINGKHALIEAELVKFREARVRDVGT